MGYEEATPASAKPPGGSTCATCVTLLNDTSFFFAEPVNTTCVRIARVVSEERQHPRGDIKVEQRRASHTPNTQRVLGCSRN